MSTSRRASRRSKWSSRRSARAAAGLRTWRSSSPSFATKPRLSDGPTMTILLLAEHDGTSLKPATLHSVTAAQKIGGEIHVLVAGNNAQSAAQAAARIAGVAKVLHA